MTESLEQVGNLMRGVPGQSLRLAVRRDIQSVRRGMELAPAVMGVSHPQTVRNYTCDTKRDTHNMSLKQFEDLLEVFPCVNTAHAVAEIAGGFFVPGVEGEEVDGDVMAGMATRLKRLSKLVNTMTQAMADNRISRSEGCDINRDYIDLVTDINRLVAIAKRMEVGRG